MPLYATTFMVVTLASIGLPGLCGFIGEFLVLFGSFTSSVLPRAQLLTILATTGVVLGAIYMLWMYQRIFLGSVREEKNRDLPDLNFRESLVFLPIIIFIVWLGVRPAFVLDRLQPSIDRVLAPVISQYHTGPQTATSDDRLKELMVAYDARFQGSQIAPPTSQKLQAPPMVLSLENEP
jgi:NADH-quinone oxidoreductase subunit M